MKMLNLNFILFSINCLILIIIFTKVDCSQYTSNNNNNNNKYKNNSNNSNPNSNNNNNSNNHKVNEWRKNEKIRRRYITAQQTLKCHERTYTFLAVQTDPVTGLQCRDYIKLMSCWGRCKTGEITDYKFPFKQSYHSVCMHGLAEMRLFELTDCDPGAPDKLRWYKTPVARSCVCRQCDESVVNCESIEESRFN